MEQQNYGLIRQHHSKLAFVSRLSDASIILTTLYASAILYGIGWSQQYLRAAVLAMFFFYLFAESLQIYRSWRGVAVKDLLKSVLLVWTLTVFGLLILAYATKSTGTYSRVTIGIWMLSVPLLLILWRILIKSVLSHFRARGFNTRRVAIAAANELGGKLAHHIQETPALMVGMGPTLTRRECSRSKTKKLGTI